MLRQLPYSRRGLVTTTSSQSGLAPNVPVQGNKQQQTSVPTTPPVRTPSLSMYIETHTPVLLQTAVTIVRNPRQLSLSTQTIIILDSGSQHSYITQGLKEDLVLCPERADKVVVKTFGSQMRRHSIVTLSSCL